MKIVIVTGASSGMGRDFALAAEKKWAPDEIWLVARRAERLEVLSGDLKCKCRIFALDLVLRESIIEIENALCVEKPEIAALINAAGFGVFTHFMETPKEEQSAMIELNIRALTEMCAICLPFMARSGAIINMGSMSSFQPVPYLLVYGATKAYVLSFTRGLNAELHSGEYAKRGLRAIAVCPYWVKTEFFERADKKNAAVTHFGKLWNSPDVVKKALRDLDRGRDVSILGIGTKLQANLTKLLPHRLVMKIWLKQQGH